MLCGDFNAQLGVEAGTRGNDPQSIRGTCLLQFMNHMDGTRVHLLVQ